MRARFAKPWMLALMLLTSSATAQVRVQDVCKLQGQRVNKLSGFGLVVGLEGTGDGGTNVPTMRALMNLHRRYAQPIFELQELVENGSVALVVVEASLPEVGAREGQRIDVTVSAIGPAKRIIGGQLLVTPMQDALLMAPNILALAGGKIEAVDMEAGRRGIIRGGATLEEEFIYNFVEEQRITLVLDDQHSSFGWAQTVARAINHALRGPSSEGVAEFNDKGELVVVEDSAVALDARNVIVRIPAYEKDNPASFVRQILETEIFELPKQEARVTINRTTKNVAFSGVVTIAPTVLQVPGVGSITIGKPDAPGTERRDSLARLEELLKALSATQATPEQVMAAIEHLSRSGSLHAKVEYVE